MALIRPSIILSFDLDERTGDAAEITSAFKRTYAYVGPTRVAFHAAPDAEGEAVEADEAPVMESQEDGFTWLPEAAPEYNENWEAEEEVYDEEAIEAMPYDPDPFEIPLVNDASVMVRLYKPYWEKGQEEADVMWNDMMHKYLHNLINKISETMFHFNRRRQIDRRSFFIRFRTFEFNFENKARIKVDLDGDSRIPAEALDGIEKVRKAMAAGIIPAQIAIAEKDPVGSIWPVDEEPQAVVPKGYVPQQTISQEEFDEAQANAAAEAEAAKAEVEDADGASDQVNAAKRLSSEDFAKGLLQARFHAKATDADRLDLSQVELLLGDGTVTLLAL